MTYKQNDYNSPDEALEELALKEANNTEDYPEEEELTVSESDAEIIEQWTKHEQAMKNHWEPLHRLMERDWDVYNLDQWTAKTKARRGLRPIETMDICQKFVENQVGGTLANPPGIKITSRSDAANDKAKLISEAIRYFEDRSGANSSEYPAAKKDIAVCGISWLKTSYSYDDQLAMPADINIKHVMDPLSVMCNPQSVEIDGSDIVYAAEFHGKDGYDKERVTYWWKSEEGIISWALLCDDKVEDKGIWPTTVFPLIPVYGSYFRIKNKTKIYGVIRKLDDIQTMMNFTVSEGIERVALTPKSPNIAPIGAIPEQYRDDWARSITNPVDMLFWEEFSVIGNETVHNTMPQRAVSTPDIGWMPTMVDTLNKAARETTGQYNIGDTNVREAYDTVKEKRENNDRGTLEYDMHLQASIKQVGKSVMALLDPVVGPAEVLPLLAEDGKISTANIGVPEIQLDPQTGMEVEVIPLPDLDVSDVEISVSTAPAYATRKQEGLDNIMSMMERMDPAQASAMVPQVIRDMGFPGADKYADRIDPQAEEVSPEMLMRKTKELEAQLAQVAQQNQQLSNDNQQLVMRLNTNTESMVIGKQIDSQTKLAVNAQDNQTKLRDTQMKIEAGAISDDKKLMADQGKLVVDNQQHTEDLVSENMRAQNKIDAQVDSDNKKLAVEARKMQQDMVDKIEVITPVVPTQF